MSSGAIILEPFELVDAPRLCSWVTCPRLLLQWAGPTFQAPLTVEQLAAHLARAQASGGTHLVFRVRDTRSGDVVGHAELGSINHQHRGARIGRVLVGPVEQRGRGLGAWIMIQVVNKAFVEFGLHRVELEVYDFNAAAIRCYEALGFRREGLRRDCVRFGAEYWNSMLMGLLDVEWGQVAHPPIWK